MSEVQPLAWVPQSVCARLARTMDQLLSNWAATWGLPTPARALSRPLGHLGTEGVAFIDLAAPLPAVWHQSLSTALFGCDVTASAVFDAVLQRVGDDLRQAVAQAFGPAGPGAPAMAARTAPGHRGVIVQAQIVTHRCGVVLSHAQWRAAAGLAEHSGSPLKHVNLEQALAGTPVALVAELGRAEVTIDELLALSPGDVLLLQETLDAPLRILAPGSALTLTAHLGATAGVSPVRAARWLAPPPTASAHDHPRH